MVIAIRSTPLSENNPYSLMARKQTIKKIYGNKVKIISIPDIEEVAYGRKVGYKIRRVRLGSAIERISATSIRGDHKRVIWLTGNVGAGKTSLAYLLKERLNAVVLDGDEMRASISLGAGFSKNQREQHNLRVARLAKILNEQGHNVVVSVIAPFASTRRKITKLIDPIWVYIKSQTVSKDKPYQPPRKPHLTIDPVTMSLTDSLEKILKLKLQKPNAKSKKQ